MGILTELIRWQKLSFESFAFAGNKWTEGN